MTTAGSPQYIALAASLSLFSGLLILLCGTLRLGFLSQLLSRPVVSGFISGSAVLIVISQLKLLLGVSASGANSWQVVRSLAENASAANPATVLIGGAALLLLHASKKYLSAALGRVGLPSIKAGFVVRLMPLLIVVAATVLVTELDLDRRHGVAVVGSVQEGLASFVFFIPELATLRTLTVPVLIMALIGMVQNITMAQALAVRRREHVDANAELVGSASPTSSPPSMAECRSAADCRARRSMSPPARRHRWPASLPASPCWPSSLPERTGSRACRWPGTGGEHRHRRAGNDRR